MGEEHAWRVRVALATVYLVWGTSYLATKIMVTDEPPLVAAGLRFLLAGVLLLGEPLGGRLGLALAVTTLALLACGEVSPRTAFRIASSTDTLVEMR